MREFSSKSPNQTRKIARICVSFIEKTAVFALVGNLGSGKTTFAKGLAEGFGIKKPATSPTFSLLKSYKLKNKWRGWSLHHFDLYRLKNKSDFLREGFADVFNQPRSIIIIEWPELIKNILPKKRINVVFLIKRNNIRAIKISGIEF